MENEENIDEQILQLSTALFYVIMSLQLLANKVEKLEAEFHGSSEKGVDNKFPFYPKLN